MSSNSSCAIFWDVDGAAIPPEGVSTQEGCEALREYAITTHGCLALFKAYHCFEPSNFSDALCLSSAMQQSGVSLSLHALSDPSESKPQETSPKDHHVITDIFMFAMDDPSKTKTVIFITSDYTKYGYVISTLYSRIYKIVVLAPGDISHKTPNYLYSLDDKWSRTSRRVSSESTDVLSTIPAISSKVTTARSSSKIAVKTDDLIPPIQAGDAILPVEFALAPTETPSRPVPSPVSRKLSLNGSLRATDDQLQTLLSTRLTSAASSYLHPSIGSRPSPPWRDFSSVLSPVKSATSQVSPLSVETTTRISETEATTPHSVIDLTPEDEIMFEEIFPPSRPLASVRSSASATKIVSDSDAKSSRRLHDALETSAELETDLSYQGLDPTPQQNPPATTRLWSQVAAGGLPLRPGALEYTPPFEVHDFWKPSSGVPVNIHPPTLSGRSIPSPFTPPPHAPSTLPSVPNSAFNLLKNVLSELYREGEARPLRSIVASRMLERDPHIYAKAGVTTFKAYVALAEERGIVELRADSPGRETIAYKPKNAQFDLLKEILSRRHASGMKRVPVSMAGGELGQMARQVYKLAGVTSFTDYVDLAVERGVISLYEGRGGGERTIALQ